MEDAASRLELPKPQCLRVTNEALAPLITHGTLVLMFPVELRAGGWAWNLRWCCESSLRSGTCLVPGDAPLELQGTPVSVPEFEKVAQFARQTHAVKSYRCASPSCADQKRSGPPPEPVRGVAKPRPDLKV